MQIVNRTKIGLLALVLGVGFVGPMAAAPLATEVDKAFVGKVSQGGLYEVEAGKIAAKRGTSPAVRNFGVLDAHDHEGVNSGLKHIAEMTGVSITPGLNAEFSQRLAKLNGTSAAEFDAYYIADMKQIHNNDEGLFVAQARQGSAPYQKFAHETAVLVNAHLGWLNSL